MAFDFPSPATVGQVFAPSGGPTWVYNGTGWAISAAGAFLPLAGGVLTGALSLNSNPALLALNKPSGASGMQGVIQAQTNGSLRWNMYISDGNQETGSNAGSNFDLVGYSDTGTTLYNAMTVTRATGAMSFTTGPSGAVNFITNNATIAPVSGAAACNLECTANNNNLISAYVGGGIRWQMQLGDGTAESGFANGSNFALYRYDNTGTIISPNPLTINRANGTVSLMGAPVRTGLTANQTFFTNFATGSDSTGDGSSGNPWKTLQQAYNAISVFYDLRGFQATINMNGQTDTMGLVVGKGWIGNGVLALINGTIAPTAASTHAIFIGNTGCTGLFELSNMTIRATGSGSYGIIMTAPAIVQCVGPVTFGACTSGMVYCATPGAQFVAASQAITLNGTAPFFVAALNSGSQVNLNAVALTFAAGTYGFSNGLVTTQYGGVCYAASMSFTTTGATFSGSVKFQCVLNSVIATATGNINYFPGDQAGIQTTGGQYT